MLTNDAFQENTRYMIFLKECSEKVYSPESQIHTHHIKPRHCGGLDEVSNYIRLSFEDHVTAHRILWEDYASEYDLAAVDVLMNSRGMTYEEKQIVGRAAHRKQYSKPGAKEHMAAVTRAKWKDPDYRAMMQEKRKSYYDRIGQEQKLRWQTSEYRDKTTAAVKKGHNTPEYKERQSERVKNWAAIPENRAKLVAAQQLRKEEIRKFMTDLWKTDTHRNKVAATKAAKKVASNASKTSPYTGVSPPATIPDSHHSTDGPTSPHPRP